MKPTTPKRRIRQSQPRQRSYRRTSSRRLLFEPLEDRYLLAADFGDAPLPYPTTLAEDGARHEATGPTLGMNRDTETDGTHSADASADGADEDGVMFGTVQVGQLGASVTVNVQNAVTGSKLDAWIDFNGDGSWGGPFEQIFDSVDVSAGDNNLTFDVPSWADDGTTMARFRLSTAGDLGVGGSAADGEVEDYRVMIAPPTEASGNFTAHTITGGAYYSVFAADMDGDDDLDVLSASYKYNSIAWYENDGTQSFTAHPITTADGAYSVFAADVDGDGDMDVLSASYNDGKIAWYENDGNRNFSLAQAMTTAADGAYSVFAADMDGDGDMDILSASAHDDKIAWYENDGGQFFTAHTITTAANAARSVFAADVDGDGDMDVLSASYNDGKIAWYENDGNRNFRAHTITTAADEASSVFAADVDGDGDLDVLSASYNDDIAWYENGGNRNFRAHTISTAASDARSVFAADVDGDGDMDVLSASSRHDKIAWYENDGTQSFTAHTISTADEASSVFAADVDGDGDLDVLSASYRDHGIHWYENENLNTLTLLIAGYSISENGGVTTATVMRADPTGDLTVNLVSDDTSEATVVASVLIADGQTVSAPFNITGVDDAVDDDTQTVTITASATGYASARDTLDVIDDETFTLSIEADSIPENGGLTTATVMRSNSDLGASITVDLHSDDPSEAVAVTPVPPSFLDAVLADAASKTGLSTNEIDVWRAHGVTWSDGSMGCPQPGEGYTQATVPGYLVVLDAGGTSLDYHLDDTGSFFVCGERLDLPGLWYPSMLTSVEIPANEASAEFVISAVDDFLVDGTQTTTITASANGYADAIESLDVTDDDAPTLTLTIHAASISEDGGTAFATVHRNTGIDGELVVSLSNGDASEVSVPTSVTILDGWASVLFTITGVDDAVIDGPQEVTITASADEYISGDDALEVTDDGHHSWQNQIDQFDVDGRDGVTPVDILTLIAYVNGGSTSLPAPPETPPPFLDVNDDNACTPLDVLLVIAFINNRQLAVPGEGEAAQFPAPIFLSEFGSSAHLTDYLTSSPFPVNAQTPKGDETVASAWATAHAADDEMPTDANSMQQAFADAEWDDEALDELDAAFAELGAVLPDLAAGLSDVGF